MLARARPNDAYRQANFDARLMGSTRDALVIFCLEDLVENLTALELAEARNDRSARSRALTRSVTALTALEMGIDRSAELAATLAHFYGAAKSVLLDQIRTTDLTRIAALKQDFVDISAAFQGAHAEG